MMKRRRINWLVAACCVAVSASFFACASDDGGPPLGAMGGTGGSAGKEAGTDGTVEPSSDGDSSTNTPDALSEAQPDATADATPEAAPDHLEASVDSEAEAGPVCGNHIVEGDEECDDGNTLDGDGCSSNCTDSTACESCEATQGCGVGVQSQDCNLFGDDELTQAGKKKKDVCWALYGCAVRTGCYQFQISDCLCGTADANACNAGFAPDDPTGANGPCANEIQDAYDVSGADPTPLDYLSVLTAGDQPGGFAMLRLQCDADTSSPTSCGPACLPRDSRAPRSDAGTDAASE